MTRSVPPIASNTAPRRAGRRVTDPSVVHDSPEETSDRGTNLPVVAGPLVRHDPAPAGAVDAQILGQEGARRGLRGGKPVLDQARHTYLGVEYSGAADRRPKRGMIAKTEL